MQKIETQYGKAERIWMMDRSISIEEVLEDRRVDDPSICCLVDTPKGRLTKLERDFLHLSWATVRQVVNGNLLPKEGQRSLFVESRDRIYKKLTMRRRLKSLVKQLKLLDLMRFNDRRSLLLKLGAANRRRWTTWTLMKIILPQPGTSDTLFDEKASGVTPHRGVSSTTHESTPSEPPFPIALIAKIFARKVGAKSALDCAPISVDKTTKISVNSISSSPRARRLSKP
ncbi:MAG: hypothetical protein CV088_21955 [Nitrospira sp. LK70]|nr:hypothetical protein [Nitrospira sp. LK70]